MSIRRIVSTDTTHTSSASHSNNTGSNFTDVIHGGSGNDILYGGTSKNGNFTDGGVQSVMDFKYLYGDEGDDNIFLSDFVN